MGSATVVGITRAPSVSEDGGVLKARCTDESQALQHAERKARTYGNALLGLASLLCLSLCGNLASSALTILVFKESRTRGAIPPVALADSRAAAPAGTGLTAYGAEGPAVKNTPANRWAPTGMKRCAVAPSGAEACWELADPQAMTNIPVDFLDGDTDLAGTLKVGAAVRTIGASAFANTKLTGLDLSEATSLVSIGDNAFFSATDLEGTLAIPTTVTTIGDDAFANPKLAGLDLSQATSLVEIGAWAFGDTDLEGTLMIPTKITKIGNSAFANTKLAGIDLSKATALVEIGARAFGDTDLAGLQTTSPMLALAVTELAAGAAAFSPPVPTLQHYSGVGAFA